MARCAALQLQAICLDTSRPYAENARHQEQACRESEHRSPAVGCRDECSDAALQHRSQTTKAINQSDNGSRPHNSSGVPPNVLRSGACEYRVWTADEDPKAGEYERVESNRCYRRPSRRIASGDPAGLKDNPL